VRSTVCSIDTVHRKASPVHQSGSGRLFPETERPRSLLGRRTVRHVDPPQNAAERFKSVRVLTDMPAALMIPTMAFISNSLGVTVCTVTRHSRTDPLSRALWQV
jgi:hypothetical protein